MSIMSIEEMIRILNLGHTIKVKYFGYSISLIKREGTILKTIVASGTPYHETTRPYLLPFAEGNLELVPAK